MRWLALFLGLVLCLAQFAFCGDIEGRVNGWQAPGPGVAHHAVVWLTDVPESTASESKFATKPMMSQAKGKFMPPFLIVVSGQTVAMPNEDDIAHNVYSNSAPKKFNLGFYAKGDYRVVTFDKLGVVEVGCAIHQGMHATIFVVPNSYYAAIKEDGTFNLSNVPKGKYTLKLWGDSIGSNTREVTVSAAGKVEVALDGAPNQSDAASKPAGEN